MTNFDKFQEEVAQFSSEYSKFTEKGNKAAGTRARKHLQEIKKIAQEIRGEINEAKKTTEA